MEKIFLRKGGCMSNTLDATKKGSYITNRYMRVDEMTQYLNLNYTRYTNCDEQYSYIKDEYTILLARAAGALYKLPRTSLIHKERLKNFMKHLYKVPGTNKQVIKKFVRIGEGSIIYGIGHHRFVEMARAAGATYKINEGSGGTVLINLERFDEYMEQFRQDPVPMKHPLLKKEGE